MSDEPDLEADRHALARAVRHQLESLRRAGLEWVPRPRDATAPGGTAIVKNAGTASGPAQAATPAELGGAPFTRSTPAGATSETPDVAPSAAPAVAPPGPGPALAASSVAPREGRAEFAPNATAPLPPATVVSPPLKASPAPFALYGGPVASAVTLPLAASGSLFGASEFGNPPVPASERPAVLEVLAAEVAACTKCTELAETRTQTVFGVGTPNARLMFIGEAPGAKKTGRASRLWGGPVSCSRT